MRGPTHPLLRKVANVGRRDMRITCGCTHYPFPHRSGSCSRGLRHRDRYPYAIYQIVPSNNPRLRFDGEGMDWVDSLQDAFSKIDQLIAENPGTHYGIVCNKRWIYVPKNL